MKSSKFETLYGKIAKITELADRVPLDVRRDVFISLYEALKEDDEQTIELNSAAQDFLDRMELKTFIDRKKPTSNIERSLLFVYFLEENTQEPITTDLVAACYQICDLKKPGNIAQNLRDASSARYGYLKSNLDTYETTEKGRLFCEA